MKSILIILVSAGLTLGCARNHPSKSPPIHVNPNMDVQERYEAQGSSKFFADGSAMRMPVAGTVARGQLREDVVFYTGRDKSGKLVRKSPVAVSLDLLKRGQGRYDIFCSPCHSRVGDGNGIVAIRGFQPPPASLHDDRLRAIEDGHLFEVTSNGVRTMPGYRSQITAADRWAIVAYLRALQRSQNAGINDVPEDLRGSIQ